MKKRAKTGFLMYVGSKFCLVALAVAVCTAILSLTAGAVVSRADGVAQTEGYYREMEKELTQRVREYLDGQGFRNSGVMVTRVDDGQGNREYTVTVHHRGIDRLAQAERERLLTELAAFDFQAEHCSFFHEFLMED